MNSALRTAILTLTCVVGGLSVGFATSVGVNVRSLGAARVSTPRCTSSAVIVLPNLSGSNYVSVTVTGLPSSCGGATVQVAVNNGTSSSTGSTSIPSGGGSVTVSLAAPVSATTVAETDVLLTGP
jgi:hypothetical protein